MHGERQHEIVDRRLDLQLEMPSVNLSLIYIFFMITDNLFNLSVPWATL